MPSPHMRPRGVTLLGMPATGKSTVGRILADELTYTFLDVDAWMAKTEDMPVGSIIAAKGREYTLALEERYLQASDLRGTVVSPPGSIIYTAGLPRLRAQSYTVLLDTPFAVLEERLHMDTLNERGVIGLTERGLRRLYEERMPLYRTWAQARVDTTGHTPAETAAAVRAILPELELLALS